MAQEQPRLTPDEQAQTKADRVRMNRIIGLVFIAGLVALLLGRLDVLPARGSAGLAIALVVLSLYLHSPWWPVERS